MKWLSLLRIGAVASVTVAVGTMLAACDHTVEPLSDPNSDPEAIAVLSPPNIGATSGPWAKCTLAADDTFGVPEVCPDPASKGCGGFSARTVELDDGNRLCVVANYCFYECDTDADCPATQSGSVTPICRAHECYLPCVVTSECPDGMVCFDDDGTENGVGNHCQWTYACPDALTH